MFGRKGVEGIECRRERVGLLDRNPETAVGEQVCSLPTAAVLVGGEQAMARIAGKEVERLAGEIETLDAPVADLDDRIEQWDATNSADAILDWWTEFSAAIRGEVVNAESVLNANQALKERFAAIFLSSPKAGTVRLDFVLRERPPGAPLVTSRLWVDDPENLPEDGTLIDFVSEDPGSDKAVANHPGGHLSTDQFCRGYRLPPLTVP